MFKRDAGCRPLPDVIAISSAECHGSTSVELDGGWKLFYSSIGRKACP